MLAYYNEHDLAAAQWLRNLIEAGLIAPGVVDDRDILDVTPADLVGFTQVHLFAGIGGWSLALRRAGWPDDRPAWTMSCPCQPFSAAGEGLGFADERHLWPAAFWLAKQHRPNVIFGEQVDSKAALAWLDLVFTDLEGENYTCGATDFCAASVGAPHRRQRLYWVADAQCSGRARPRSDSLESNTWANGRDDLGRRGNNGTLADAERSGFGGRRASQEGDEPGSIQRFERLRALGPVGNPEVERCSNELAGGCGCQEPIESPSGDADGGLANPIGNGRRKGGNRNHARDDGSIPHSDEPIGDVGDPEGIGRFGREDDENGRGRECPPRPANPTNGFWRGVEWLPCTDGKARPTQPGVTPLAHGVPGRVVKLRAYGNAICVDQAKEFIAAYGGSRK